MDYEPEIKIVMAQTPRILQKTKMARPTGVRGEKSPYPMDVKATKPSSAGQNRLHQSIDDDNH